MSFPQENYDENYIRLSRLDTIFGSIVETDLKEKAVKKILQKNGNINYQIPANRYFRAIQPDWIGYTALHLAVEKRQLEICKMLIQHGADFTIKNSVDETPLHQAMKSSNNTHDKCWNLKSKLDHPFADVILSAHLERNIPSNPCNNFGLTHFHIACMTNHTKAVEYFLKNGTSVNESIALDSPVLPGFSPLHFAARYCAFEVVEILLHYGADVHVKDILGKSPIHILIERNMQIVDCMNSEPSDVSQIEFDTNKRMIKLLLVKHKIFSSATVDDIGLSWEQVACALQDMAMLLDHSALQNNTINSDSPMWPGYTALHFAAHFSIDAVIFLITKGADCTIKDSAGITPLDLCLQRYQAKDIHSIIISQPTWKNIQFSDNKTNLSDLILTMNSYDDMKLFLQESVPDLNIFIPLDSELWPGCTLLHVAVILIDRTKDIDDLYEDIDYVKEDCNTESFNVTEDEAKLYQQRIELCLDLGADVTIKDARGSTPLHHAFYAKKSDVVGLLLKKHKKIINATDNNGLSHLHIACAMGDKSLVNKFLRAGCDVNSRVNSRYDFNVTLLNDEDEQEEYNFSISPGSTALHIAVSIGDQELSKMLVKHGADLYAQDDLYGLTPIHLSIISSFHLICEGMVEKDAVNLLSLARNLKECTSNFGLTHLHVACKMHDVKAVKKLLDLGANPDATIAPYDEDESTPWYYFRKAHAGAKPITLAWQASSTKIMTLLMSRGADILYKTVDLSIPFCIFLRNTLDENEVIYSMLKRDQIVQARIVKETGVTMLHLACGRLQVDDVKKLLMRHGANPNAQTHVDSPIWPGYTPLHLLLSKGENDIRSCKTILALLLEHGADISLANADGNTPLHEAFMSTFMDDYPFLRMPTEAHKDFSVNPVNAHGISHFHLACHAQDMNSIKSFLEKGVNFQQPIDFFSKHNGGATPLHLAAAEKCEEAVRILLRAGADVAARTSCGYIPLHEAVSGLHNFTRNLLKLLIDAGSDLYAQSWAGTTVLELLLMSSNKPKGILELFWKPGSPVNIFNAVTGEGYICIMATNDLDGLESIQQNPFYKEVIDNPERNRVDDMGRTPIHNVVSCCYARIQPVDCAVLIDGFIKIGCDIDCRDKKGRTALHLASHFKNGFGIVGLLMNGIDVNLLDLEGNAAFAYSLQPGILEEHGALSHHSYILRNTVEHLYKLKLFELCVNNVNAEIYEQIPLAPENITRLTEDCRKELEKLKERKIGSHAISGFLSETGLVASFRTVPEQQRKEIDRIFRNESPKWFEDYPELIGLLKLQYRKAVARETLIQPAHVSLNSLTGFSIPHVCIHIIFGFLANDDLKSLIVVNK